MKTNEKKYKAKLARLQKQVLEIRDRHPNFDFFNLPMINDIDKHRELMKSIIYLKVDIQGCQEQMFKCENCICK